MGPNFSIKFDTTDVRRMERNGKRLTKDLRRAVNEVLTMIFNESQILVPVDTGALKASGKLILSSPGSTRFDSTITYGSDGSDGRPPVTYAVEVHEDLQAHHTEPTQAKFLEVPADRYSSYLKKKIGMTVRAVMEKK
jgi:hypothetical protein